MKNYIGIVAAAAAVVGTNAFAEDLGFKNVYVLDGGIKAWISEEKALVSFLK